MSDEEIRQFTQRVIDNIKKNGFPDRMVSFDLDTLYEAASKRGISFNKVLDTLHEIQIGHVKTPEKIIFYPRDRMAEPVFGNSPPPAPPIDPELFKGMNLDPESLKGMNLQDMMARAAEMVSTMSPEQLQKIQEAFSGMSDADKQAMLERARGMGLIK